MMETVMATAQLRRCSPHTVDGRPGQGVHTGPHAVQGDAAITREGPKHPACMPGAHYSCYLDMQAAPTETRSARHSALVG